MFVILHPEIRLKEYGKETVEVIDNGSGILPANYEALGIVLLSVCSVVYLIYLMCAYVLLQTKGVITQ